MTTLSTETSPENIRSSNLVSSLVEASFTETNQQDNGEHPLHQTLIAGLLAGVTGDFLVYSLDTLKTRLQVPNCSYTGNIDALTSILKNEGIQGFYGGCTAAMLGSALSSVIYFGTYESVKCDLIRRAPEAIPEPAIHFLAGGIGDLSCSLVYVPLEVVKTRMQVQGIQNLSDFPKEENNYHYTSLRNAIRRMYVEEGLSSFFRGYSATLFREIPFSAVQFMVYERMKRAFIDSAAEQEKCEFLYQRRQAKALYKYLQNPHHLYHGEDSHKLRQHYFHHQPIPSRLHRRPSQICDVEYIDTGIPVHFESETTNEDKFTLFQSILSGAVAGFIGGALTTPFDVIKTRDQLSNTHCPKPLFTSLVNVMKREGPLVLFSGFVPRVLWTTPQASWMFLVYELVLRVCFDND